MLKRIEIFSADVLTPAHYICGKLARCRHSRSKSGLVQCLGDYATFEGGELTMVPESHSSQSEALVSAWVYTRRFSLDGSRRVEFRINVSSEATWTKAAINGFSIPAAAKPMPIVSTIRVP